ncbi:hypothetical protein [Massilia varians]|nr:hypothetical protein [Massilia varians]
MDQEESKISSGSHSINIGSGTVKNSHLHVGDVHHYGRQSAEAIAIIDRVYTKPLTLLGTPLQAGWIVVSGILGVTGSIATIAGFWKELSFLFVLILSIALFFLIVGVSLIRHRFVRLPYLPFNVEADSSGKTFITKVQGNCPRCDGKLKLREIGPKENAKTFVRCTRNPDHIWNFDFTVLDEPKA